MPHAPLAQPNLTLTIEARMQNKTNLKNRTEGSLTRRQFVVSSTMASGGLALGFHFPAACKGMTLTSV